MTDRYAVVGNPVAHSLSPRIHAAFAAASGQDMGYERLLAPRDGFADTVRQFFAEGGAGLNVTVPFKAEALALMDRLDAAAEAAGAVNTIVIDGDGLCGCNTDGAGLVRDLTGNCALSLAGARILLVGAGGAALGAVRPLLAAGPAALTIANRTAPRAAELAARLQREGFAAAIIGVEPGEVRGPFDLLINATSAGLDSEVPALHPAAPSGAVCYDMMYAPAGSRGTAFGRWAQAHDAVRVVDGLGMLVEQAALAFALWRGVEPDTAAILRELREPPGENPVASS